MLTRSCSSVAGLELFQHFSIADDSSQGWIGLACVLCCHFFESTIALKVVEGGVRLSVITSVSGHCLERVFGSLCVPSLCRGVCRCPGIRSVPKILNQSKVRGHVLILYPKPVLFGGQQRQKDFSYVCGHLRQYHKEKRTVAKESVVLCKISIFTCVKDCLL